MNPVDDPHYYAFDGIHIETLQSPKKYSKQQMKFACLVQALLDRGKLVVCEPPA